MPSFAKGLLATKSQVHGLRHRFAKVRMPSFATWPFAKVRMPSFAKVVASLVAFVVAAVISFMFGFTKEQLDEDRAAAKAEKRA